MTKTRFQVYFDASATHIVAASKEEALLAFLALAGLKSIEEAVAQTKMTEEALRKAILITEDMPVSVAR